MYIRFAFWASLAGAVIAAVFLPLSPFFLPLWFLAGFFGLILLFFLAGILMAPFFSKKRVYEKPNRLARFMLVEAYCIGLFFVRARCRVEGKEKLPPKGTTFLLVCNHLSNYDHMLMLTKLRRYPIAFISKPENFRIPFVGRYLRASGFLAIDRGSARHALTTVNETASRIGGSGMCYGVFPEGTRSRTGNLLPFHSGVFLSATKAKSPILVIHMKNTDRINHRAPWRSTRVRLDVLEYLDSDFTSTTSNSEICQYIYEGMLAHEEKLERQASAKKQSIK